MHRLIRTDSYMINPKSSNKICKIIISPRKKQDVEKILLKLYAN